MVRVVYAAWLCVALMGGVVTPLLRLEGEIISDKQNAAETVISEQTESQAPMPAIEFPKQISDTELWVERVSLYEGAMLEDNSDDYIVDAAALELYNSGSKEISMAEITLVYDQTQMVFFATNIPAGGRLLVIEEDGKLWTQDACTDCSGWVQYSEDASLLQDALEIKDVNMGTVSVTNTTDDTIADLWLFYKNYLSDADLYLGGITYITQIPLLDPGQTLLINPEHYASGYSKFIKAVEME